MSATPKPHTEEIDVIQGANVFYFLPLSVKPKEKLENVGTSFRCVRKRVAVWGTKTEEPACQKRMWVTPTDETNVGLRV